MHRVNFSLDLDQKPQFISRFDPNLLEFMQRSCRQL